MTENRKNTIKEFWHELADADLGSKVTFRAREIANFFDELLSVSSPSWYTDYHDMEEYAASDFGTYSRIAAYLRGFQAHTGYYADDGLVLSLCGTLHSVIMREDVVEEFQNFMIQLTPEDDPEDVMFNWLWRYQNLQLEKDGQSKRKIRRSRKAR